MEFRQLRSFVTIVKHNNFTHAANELGYAQSTITSHIHDLEQDLGTMLFERLGKKVSLTKDGEYLFTYATQILKLCSEAKETISSPLNPRGSLMIGTPESLCTHHLTEIFNTFRSNYPNVEINLRFDTCNDYRSHLRKNLADVAFILDNPLIDTDFISHILFEESMSVIASPAHHLAQRHSVTPHCLNNEPLVLTDSSCSYRQVFENILTDTGSSPSTILGFSSVEVIKKFVCDGWGIGFVPLATITQELSNNSLIELPWVGPSFNIQAQLIYHKDKWLSPSLQAFIKVTSRMFNLPKI